MTVEQTREEVAPKLVEDVWRIVVGAVDATGKDVDGVESRSFGSEPEEALEEIFKLLEPEYSKVPHQAGLW